MRQRLAADWPLGDQEPVHSPALRDRCGRRAPCCSSVCPAASGPARHLTSTSLRAARYRAHATSPSATSRTSAPSSPARVGRTCAPPAPPYIDLTTQLLKAHNTDGYETAWFYQRLSAACANTGPRRKLKKFRRKLI